MKAIASFLALLFLSLPAFSQSGIAAKNYQMVPYKDNTGRDVCLVWDATTGASKFYAWNNTITNWKPYEINLPATPIPGAEGEVHLYPYVDNSGRDVVLAWDNFTGKSVYYAWNNGISDWKAHEVNLPRNPIEDPVGAIMMRPYVDNTGRDICLIWDNETGKSAYYAWKNSISDWKVFSVNLPEVPLAGAAGKIHMRPYIDNTGRDVCLVWDAASGKSVFYRWSNSITNWKPYTINLPEQPLADAKQDVMMRPYIDNSGRAVCLVWDIAQGASLFYAWDDGIDSWKPYQLNLPVAPLPHATGLVFHHPYVDNAGRDVCLVWDNRTGESVYYAWNGSISNWKAYEINLPADPLPETDADAESDAEE